MNGKFPPVLADVIFDGAYIVDRKRRMLAWNKAAEEITGFSASEVMGKGCHDGVLQHVDEKGDDLCRHRCPLVDVLAGHDPHKAEVYLHHKDGHRVKVEVRCLALRNEEGQITSALEVFREVTPEDEQLKEIETLKKETMTDPLTKAGNRRYGNIMLQDLTNQNCLKKHPVCIAILDIDHFKRVNDGWGHVAGDKVLQMVANSLQAALRPKDILCRWGGEEFLVILPDTKARNLYQIVERMRLIVGSAWLDVDSGDQIRATISIGAAQVSPGETHESALSRADELLYQAKREGRNRCCVQED